MAYQFQHSTHHLHDEEVVILLNMMTWIKLIKWDTVFPTQYGGYAAFVVFNMMFGESFICFI